MSRATLSLPMAPRLAMWLHGRPKLAMAVVLALCAAAAAQLGAVPIAPADWLAPWSAGSDQPLSGSAYVLWHLRLPRAALAMLVGAAMGYCGALTQGLFRNPLADPSLLGVTSGAASAAALTIVFLGSVAPDLPFAWRYGLLPLTAFAGALSVCFVLDRIARWLTFDSVAGLLLTGVALNALAVAVIGLCTFLANDEQLRNLSFWTLGSLAGAGWGLAATLLVLLAAALLRMRKLIRSMNALALGESAAAHVGINVRSLRTQVIVLVALLCGFSVAWCGVINFVGLLAPHIVRTMVGPDQRLVTPLSMGMGALLLLVADTLARTLAAPAEVPVGIFTALLGAPFFLMLLFNNRSKGG